MSQLSVALVSRSSCREETICRGQDEGIFSKISQYLWVIKVILLCFFYGVACIISQGTPGAQVGMCSFESRGKVESWGKNSSMKWFLTLKVMEKECILLISWNVCHSLKACCNCYAMKHAKTYCQETFKNLI